MRGCFVEGIVLRIMCDIFTYICTHIHIYYDIDELSHERMFLRDSSERIRYHIRYVKYWWRNVSWEDVFEWLFWENTIMFVTDSSARPNIHTYSMYVKKMYICKYTLTVLGLCTKKIFVVRRKSCFLFEGHAVRWVWPTCWPICMFVLFWSKEV